MYWVEIWTASARELGIAFVDLTRSLADSYQSIGPDEVKELFGSDSTHTNAAVAEGLSCPIALAVGQDTGPPPNTH